jgi:hypothetical protein
MEHRGQISIFHSLMPLPGNSLTPLLGSDLEFRSAWTSRPGGSGLEIRDLTPLSGLELTPRRLEIRDLTPMLGNSPSGRGSRNSRSDPYRRSKAAISVPLRTSR